MKDLLEKLNIDQLSEMQEEMVEKTKGNPNSDLLLLSPTGSGKTLAYLISAMRHVDYSDPSIQVLVVTPSRELALQSNDLLLRMKSPLRSQCLIGGHATSEDLRIYKQLQPQIIFATPGRINFYLKNSAIESNGIRLLIIDEFDKCLDMGFSEEMKEVRSALPKDINTWLISATNAPSDFEKYISLSKSITLNYLKTADDKRLDTYIVNSPLKDKLETLRDLLIMLNGEPTIVFVSYRESVERVYKYLKQEHFFAEKYHGGMEQRDRERALYKFRSGGSNVLVSTDLAARGLDIAEVKHIVHYHIPTDEAAFEHRNGRSTRWENRGASYVILGPEEPLPAFSGIPDAEVMEIVHSEKTPTVPEWTTLYIGRGKKEKVSKGDVLGFLCKKGGLKGCDIGRIDIEAHCSYVAIRRSKTKPVLRAISGEKIKDMKTIIEPMR